MSDSAVGGSGLKLKVYVNGDYGVPSLVYFNKRQQSRGISDDKIILARVSKVFYNVYSSLWVK